MSIKLYLKPKNKLKQVDFNKLKIHHDYHSESEIEFTTPDYVHVSQNAGVDVKVVSDLFEKFGGMVRTRTTDTDDNLYDYTGYDYSSFLRGTFWKSFNSKTTKQICQWIAKDAKIKTTSLFNAKKTHKKLVFKGETTRMNAIRQVCALDNESLRPYVNYNKKLGLKYVANENSGFVIHVGDYICAEESLDLNDLVNHIIIYTKKGKVKKTYKNKNSMVEYGDLTKILNYPEKPKKGGSDVQDIYDDAKKDWYEKSKVNYKTIVELPLTKAYKKLAIGYKLVFKFDGDSAMNNKKYWIQELDIIVEPNVRKLKLTLLDRKPFLFDDWKYKDPDGKSVNRTQKKYSVKTFTTSNNIVKSSSLVNKASDCTYCAKGLTSNNVTYENKCPACGAVKKLTQKSNSFVCSNCNVKFCAKCGSELRKPKRYTLKRASASGKPSGVSNAMYDKALALWSFGPLEIAYFVCSFTYVFYSGDQESTEQTFKDHTGNCVDLAQVVIAMYKCVGITGSLAYTTVVLNGVRYDHVNVKIKINGVTYIIDPSCTGTTTKPANMNDGKFVGR